MRIEHSLLIAGSIIVGLLAFSIGFAARRTNRLTNGSWGGLHIRMEINNGAAEIDYDCANGAIGGPLTFDSQGRFSWPGFYTRESHGPIRMGKTPARMSATYSGSIKGDTMSLTVKLPDGQTLDSFTLTRGSSGRVWKCK